MRVTSVTVYPDKLRAALLPPLKSGTEALGRKSERRIKERISVPVGRDANGNVVVRSQPGEPPRKEHGQLQSHVAHSVEVQGEKVVGSVYSHRPPREPGDDPDAAVRLEYGGYSHGVHIEPRPHVVQEVELLRGEAAAEYADQLKAHLRR
jgi:hypothetical protein